MLVLLIYDTDEGRGAMSSPGTGNQLDMTMMFAIHEALRRDLERIAQAAAVAGDDPAGLHVTHFGWQLFKEFLTLHHTTEDAVLWPRMRELVAGRADDLELLDAMEQEHGRIDPLIEAVDAALADHEHGHDRLGDVADALVTEVGGHLDHEEQDALPLVSRVLPAEDWDRFGAEQRSRTSLDAAARYLPWLLDEARSNRAADVLRFIPPHLQELYRNSWLPAYREKNPWNGVRESA
jgi:hemerythrin-like domain-containing protein